MEVYLSPQDVEELDEVPPAPYRRAYREMTPNPKLMDRALSWRLQSTAPKTPQPRLPHKRSSRQSRSQVSRSSQVPGWMSDRDTSCNEDYYNLPPITIPQPRVSAEADKQNGQLNNFAVFNANQSKVTIFSSPKQEKKKEPLSPWQRIRGTVKRKDKEKRQSQSKATVGESKGKEEVISVHKMPPLHTSPPQHRDSIYTDLDSSNEILKAKTLVVSASASPTQQAGAGAHSTKPLHQVPIPKLAIPVSTSTPVKLNTGVAGLSVEEERFVTPSPTLHLPNNFNSTPLNTSTNVSRSKSFSTPSRPLPSLPFSIQYHQDSTRNGSAHTTKTSYLSSDSAKPEGPPLPPRPSKVPILEESDDFVDAAVIERLIAQTTSFKKGPLKTRNVEGNRERGELVDKKNRPLPDPPAESKEVVFPVPPKLSQPPSKEAVVNEIPLSHQLSDLPTESKEAVVTIPKSPPDPPTESKEAVVNAIPLPPRLPDPPTESNEAVVTVRRTLPDPPAESKETVVTVNRTLPDPPTESKETVVGRTLPDPPTESKEAVVNVIPVPPRRSQPPSKETGVNPIPLPPRLPNPPSESNEAVSIVSRRLPDPPTESKEAMVTIPQTLPDPPTEIKETVVGRRLPDPPIESKETVVGRRLPDPPIESKETVVGRRLPDLPIESKETVANVITVPPRRSQPLSKEIGVHPIPLPPRLPNPPTESKEMVVVVRRRLPDPPTESKEAVVNPIPVPPRVQSIQRCSVIPPEVSLQNRFAGDSGEFNIAPTLPPRTRMVEIYISGKDTGSDSPPPPPVPRHSKLFTVDIPSNSQSNLVNETEPNISPLCTSHEKEVAHETTTNDKLHELDTSYPSNVESPSETARNAEAGTQQKNNMSLAELRAIEIEIEGSQEGGEMGVQIQEQEGRKMDVEIHGQEGGEMGVKIQGQEGEMSVQIQEQEVGEMGVKIQGQEGGETSVKIQGEEEGEMDVKIQGEEEGEMDVKIQGQEEGGLNLRSQGQEGGEMDSRSQRQEGGEMDSRSQGQEGGEMDSRSQGQERGEMDSRSQGQEGRETDKTSQVQEGEDKNLRSQDQEGREMDSRSQEQEGEHDLRSQGQEKREMDLRSQGQEGREMDSISQGEEGREMDSISQGQEGREMDSMSQGQEGRERSLGQEGREVDLRSQEQDGRERSQGQEEGMNQEEEEINLSCQGQEGREVDLISQEQEGRERSQRQEEGMSQEEEEINLRSQEQEEREVDLGSQGQEEREMDLKSQGQEGGERDLRSQGQEGRKEVDLRSQEQEGGRERSQGQQGEGMSQEEEGINLKQQEKELDLRSYRSQSSSVDPRDHSAEDKEESREEQKSKESSKNWQESEDNMSGLESSGRTLTSYEEDDKDTPVKTVISEEPKLHVTDLYPENKSEMAQEEPDGGLDIGNGEGLNGKNDHNQMNSIYGRPDQNEASMCLTPLTTINLSLVEKATGVAGRHNLYTDHRFPVSGNHSQGSHNWSRAGFWIQALDRQLQVNPG